MVGGATGRLGLGLLVPYLVESTEESLLLPVCGYLIGGLFAMLSDNLLGSDPWVIVLEWAILFPSRERFFSVIREVIPSFGVCKPNLLAYYES